VITAWDSKSITSGDRSRPFRRNNDGNPRTDGDLSWTPLINTPPYPDYTSGANNVTGATTQILKLFFGKDDLLAHSAAAQSTRTYNRFGRAPGCSGRRVYQGIHFRFADVVARRKREVAKWAFRHSEACS
jgi:hypothetical protein